MTETHEWLKEIARGTASPQLRDMASRGLVPFPPVQMVLALGILTAGSDETIRDQAHETTKRLPHQLVLEAAASRAAHPIVFKHILRCFYQDAEILSALAVNPAVSDDVLLWIADKAPAAVLDVLGRNQDRLRKSLQLMSRLAANPHLPPHLKGYLEEEMTRQTRAAREVVEAESLREGATEEKHEVVFEEVLVKDHEKEDEALAHPKRVKVQEDRRKSIYQIIRMMSIPEKVVLALKGNKDARGLLIRESNKMVSTKVLESPRLSDAEVESYARMTNVSDDVLRTISLNKEWMGKYNIQKALVSNAKTPIGVSLGLVGKLSLRDLTNLGRNRNVPEVIRGTASKIARMRRESKKPGS
jgi:hypothetical protein